MMPFRSIRTRLTLWYFAILALILVLFAAGVYVTMRRLLSESLDDTLENRAFLTRELVAFDARGTPGLRLSDDSSNLDLEENFQRLLNPDGDILFDNSQQFGDVPVDDAAIQRALSGGSYSATLGEGKRQARVLTLPVERDGEVAGVLQVGASTEDMRDTLRYLLFVFAVALPVALALATAGGYWLSSRALAPIDKITRAAQDIGEHDLGRRLGPGLPDDDVGRLGRTFDGMISRLEAAFQRQRQFTADASHELRTPLAAIRGQIDVALQRPRDAAAYQQVLATVNEQVDRMTRLIRGLLMLARTDARAMPLERERVDAAELVNSVAEQVRPLAEAKGLTLTVSGGGTAAVRGDEDLLLQMLLNLADNAIKYTSSGPVQIAWRDAGDSVEISVSDSGPGIPAEQQDPIFERFYRADAARSREQGGAGLGLAICRWIAEEHGGAIHLRSSERGSTFAVTLPKA